MVSKVKQYIETHNMIIKGDTIILGISGGADSVCLFFVLLKLKSLYDLKLVAVHVNHNLRGEDARRDQAYVEELCSIHGIPCVVVSADVQEESKIRKKSVEETGREIRREAFAKAAAEYRGTKIATAHHSNDNAETMLMNLARGTGISGLVGIAPMVGERIRPLLGVSRIEIEKYLEEINESYCIDSTNHENIYIRNIIRNKIIPTLETGVNAQVVSHMEETMEELRKVVSYLDAQLETHWESVVEVIPGGRLIKTAEMETLPAILRERVVKRALEQTAGRQRDLTRRHINQILELLEKQVGREIHLPYQILGKRTYQGVTLIRNPEVSAVFEAGNQVKTRVLDRIQWEKMGQEIQEHPYTKHFDYDIIGKTIGIRTRQTGDYITINPNGNTQTLKKYFITNKIPEHQRDRIPLLVRGEEVLWVMGYRVGCGCEVTEQTKRILEIQYDGGNYGRNS